LSDNGERPSFVDRPVSLDELDEPGISAKGKYEDIYDDGAKEGRKKKRKKKEG